MHPILVSYEAPFRRNLRKKHWSSEGRSVLTLSLLQLFCTGCSFNIKYFFIILYIFYTLVLCDEWMYWSVRGQTLGVSLCTPNCQREDRLPTEVEFKQRQINSPGISAVMGNGECFSRGFKGWSWGMFFTLEKNSEFKRPCPGNQPEIPPPKSHEPTTNTVGSWAEIRKITKVTQHCLNTLYL